MGFYRSSIYKNLKSDCVYSSWQKMDGRAGGLNLTGKGLKEKRGRLSIQRGSGMEIQMIKVIIYRSYNYKIFIVLVDVD